MVSLRIRALFLGFCAFAMPAIVQAAPKAKAAPALRLVKSAEQQILDLDQAWIAAEIAGDRAALARILDEHFVATFDAGDLLGKEAFLKFVIDGRRDPTKTQRLTDRSVRVDGDTGILVETESVGGTADGKAYSYDTRLTSVYLRRRGAWKAVALHLVRRPPQR